MFEKNDSMAKEHNLNDPIIKYEGWVIMQQEMPPEFIDVEMIRNGERKPIIGCRSGNCVLTYTPYEEITVDSIDLWKYIEPKES